MRTCAANAPRTAEPQLWPACMNSCEEASSRDDCAGSLPGEVERDGSRRSAVGRSVLQSPWVSTRAERADVGSS
jgi:hypothetical protein